MKAALMALKMRIKCDWSNIFRNRCECGTAKLVTLMFEVLDVLFNDRNIDPMIQTE
jgi:hypothetical protein